MARGLGVSVKFEGVDKMLRKLEKHGEAAMRAGAAGVYLAAEEVMTAAVRVTPKSKHGGWLRNTKYVTEPEHLEKPQSELGFSAQYAPYVHERFTATNWTTAGTGPKFLERPLLRMKNDILKIIARNVGAAYKTGVRRRKGGGKHPKNPPRGDK